MKQPTKPGLFLDTGDLKEIEKYHAMGIIRGVTTNPTILVKQGVKSGMKGVKEHSLRIAKLIAPLPLSVEVTTNDFKGMRRQALEFSRWAENINVKITIHGPNGEMDNLKLIHELETEENIRVNVTAMMSAQQCFIAAMAGATYVSIFGGRVNDMGYDAGIEVRKLRKLLDDFELPSQIIVGSSRETFNLIQWFEAGAHIVTAAPALLKNLIIHPYSKETVQQFIKDGAQFEKGLKKT